MGSNSKCIENGQIKNLHEVKWQAFSTLQPKPKDTDPTKIKHPKCSYVFNNIQLQYNYSTIR